MFDEYRFSVAQIVISSGDDWDFIANFLMSNVWTYIFFKIISYVVLEFNPVCVGSDALRGLETTDMHACSGIP